MQPITETVRRPPEESALQRAVRLRDPEGYLSCVKEAVAALRARIAEFPRTLIVLGSGLGGLADQMRVEETIPYSEIPHMPTTRTGSHVGSLLVGELAGRRVAAFKGRVHVHDGYTPQEVVFGTFVMTMCGSREMIVTNAAGGIREGFRVGDIMLLRNHNSLFLPDDPTRGISSNALGPDKFYAQTHPYDDELIKRAQNWLTSQGVRHHEGVYAFVMGPRFESAADVRTLQFLQADAVGMSTVPEVLAFRHALPGQARVLGISVITNVAAGLSDQDPNDAEVQEAGRRVGGTLCGLVEDVLRGLSEQQQ